MFWWDLDVALLVLGCAIGGMITGFFRDRSCAPGLLLASAYAPREVREASGLRAASPLLASAGRRSRVSSERHLRICGRWQG
jgi:hypothetical protein